MFWKAYKFESLIYPSKISYIEQHQALESDRGSFVLKIYFVNIDRLVVWEFWMLLGTFDSEAIISQDHRA